MSTFVASLSRAYNFFISPTKERRLPTEPGKRQNLTSLERAKSSSNGQGSSKKSKSNSICQDKSKRSKISKHVDKATTSKTKPKSMGRKRNISDLSKCYDGSTLISSGEIIEEVCFEGETLIENKENTPTIKCEVESEDENMTLVEESSHDTSQTCDETCISTQVRILQADDPRIEDWSEDEIWVFNKLVMRGREPILPYELASEFPSWPDMLFTKNPAKIVIKNHRCSMTNLASAFNRFVHEGSSTRCRLQGATNPEPSIERALKGFHKFIIQDGRFRLKQNPPLICIVAAVPNEDVARVVERCRNKMYKAGRQWRQWLLDVEHDTSEVSSPSASGEGDFAARLPTIYGFVVKNSILAIMTWDSSQGEEEGEAKPVRTIGTYDWNIMGQDVWHALAVGIVECKARAYLMELDRDGLLGQDQVESDPDL